MTGKGRWFRLVRVALVLALIAQSLLPVVLPAYAQGPPPQGAKPANSSAPPMEASIRQEVERYAQLTAASLVFQADGKVGLNTSKAARLTALENERLTRLVSDINAGKIGIAITREGQPTKLYGNPKALEVQRPSNGADALDNSWWTDGYGVHIYIDPWWTDQMIDLVGWAIGEIIGVVVGVVCATGIGCLLVGWIIDFVWDMIWGVLRSYFPDSFTIHLPWWGWAGVQVWRANAYYNGWWFQSWLWT